MNTVILLLMILSNEAHRGNQQFSTQPMINCHLSQAVDMVGGVSRVYKALATDPAYSDIAAVIYENDSVLDTLDNLDSRNWCASEQLETFLPLRPCRDDEDAKDKECTSP